MQPSSHYRIRFTGAIASLVVLEAEEDDSGLYECVLSSGGGEIRTSCSLFVTGEQKEITFIDLETLGFGLASTHTHPHSTQVSIFAYLLPFPLFPCPVVTHNESIFL